MQWISARILCLGLLSTLSCAPYLADEESTGERAGSVTQAVTCSTFQRGVLGATADTEIQQALPTQPGGAKATLRAGANASSTLYSLFHFDLSSVPADATVQSAVVHLAQSGATAAQTLAAHAVTATWNEASLTFQSFGSAFDPTPFTTFANAGVGAGAIAIDVTQLAAGWVSGAAPNGGILVARSGPSGSSGNTFFVSSEGLLTSRPSLTVCYDAASCSDGLQNQGEVGVDCGGPCPACNGCAPGATQACYSGPAGTEGAGLCAPGTQTCDANGVFGPCLGEVLPARESCATPEHESCGPACGDHVFSLKLGDDAHVQAGEFVTADAAGNLYLTGSFSGTMALGGGAVLTSVAPNVYDGYLIKLSPTGAHLWSKTVGNGTNPQFNYGVVVDAAGDVILTGMARGVVDFGGGPLSTKSQDVFIAKYDAAGSHLWSKIFGDWTPSQIGLVVAVDASSNIYLGSQVQGSINFGGGNLTSAGDYDVALAKLSPAGNHVWSRMFGGPGRDVLKEITVTPSGDVVLAGDHAGTINFGGGALVGPAGVGQAFLAQLDASGTHVWSAVFPGGVAGDAPSTVQSVRLDPAGDLLVLGTFTSAIDFGGGPLFGAPYPDASFLAKLTFGGAHVWSRAVQTTLGRLALTPSGGAFVAAFDPGLGSPNDFGDGSLPPGGSVAKYDGDGQLVWSRWFGAGNPNGIFADALGSVLVTGDITTSIDFGGGPLATVSKQAMFVAKLGDGDSYLTNSAPLPPGTPLSTVQIGSSGSDSAESVAIDAASNVYTTGWFSGTIDLGTGPLTSAGARDVFVSKRGPTGQPLWTKSFGGSGLDVGWSLSVSPAGEVVVAGTFQNTVDFGGGALVSANPGTYDVFVLKLNALGQHVFSLRFGAANDDYAFGVAIDESGDVLVTGSFFGAISIGGIPLTSMGGRDTFLAKLGGAGAALWAKRFGSPTSDYGYGVAAGPGGRIVMTGNTTGTIDFGGGPHPGAGANDAFVIELDALGQLAWAQRFGDAGGQNAYSAAFAPNGDVVVAGDFTGSMTLGDTLSTSATIYDAFVARFAPNGTPLWARSVGSGQAHDIGRGVAVDPLGNVLLTGFFRSTVAIGQQVLISAGAFDVFVAKYDPQGSPLWARGFGDASDQFAYWVTTDAAANVYVAGGFDGDLDTGTGLLQNAGGRDGFVATFAP